jgi:hypothetical protein
MSREKSSNGTPPLERVAREQVSFGEPAMFWVDEAHLQEYTRLEVARLNQRRDPKALVLVSWSRKHGAIRKLSPAGCCCNIAAHQRSMSVSPDCNSLRRRSH